MRVLVTGSTGFVAQHLLPALGQRHEVYALGHDPSRTAEIEGVQHLTRDLRDTRALDLPDVAAIVHLAQANVPFPDGAVDLDAVNTAATVALLDHARRCGAKRFVFTSSASVYGFGDRPWKEDDEPAATDFYSATKLAAERYVTTFQDFFETTILRLVAPYGPGQRNRMIPRLIESVRDGRAITLNEGSKPVMNPIYIDDVVRVVDSTIASTGNHLVNVAGDEALSIEDICVAIGHAVDRDPVFERGGGTAAGDIVCDNARMHETFDIDRLVTFDEGARRTVESGEDT